MVWNGENIVLRTSLRNNSCTPKKGDTTLFKQQGNNSQINRIKVVPDYQAATPQ